MDFEEALLSVYRSTPCQVLPNAFWKTRSLIEDMDSSYEKNDKVKKLLMRDDKSLHVYWTEDRDGSDLDKQYLNELEFALIHEDYIDCIPVESFSNIQRYFRMYHGSRDIPTPDVPPGFKMKDVEIEDEADKVSRLICRCYDNIKPDEEEVISWTKHPVFDEDLWVWVRDIKENRYAGLGIAELDKTIPEASLEWIQVDPDYHGQGLGRIIVYELLKRVKGLVEFVTVGGEYDTEGNPKGFYENCGFRGNDIWYVLREKSE